MKNGDTVSIVSSVYDFGDVTETRIVRSIEYTVEGGYVCGKCEGDHHNGNPLLEHGPHCPLREIT